MNAATFYQSFFAHFDAAMRAGADSAMLAGLARMRELMPYALVPLVVCWGVMLAAGALTRERALSYGTRLAVFLWLVASMAYVPMVRDLVLEDIPSEIAGAVSGSGSRLNAAQQFDVLDDAAAHFVANIKAQATCLACSGTRLTADAVRAAQKTFLGLIFYLWIAFRTATYLLVAAGAFMLLFILFESTRGWVREMWGKMVSVSVWHLTAAILLKVSLAGLTVLMRGALENPGGSLDEQMETAQDIAGWFAGCFLMILVLPWVASVAASIVPVQNAAAKPLRSAQRHAAAALTMAAARTLARVRTR